MLAIGPWGGTRPAEAADRHRRRPDRHDRPGLPGPDHRLCPLPRPQVRPDLDGGLLRPGGDLLQQPHPSRPSLPVAQGRPGCRSRSLPRPTVEEHRRRTARVQECGGPAPGGRRPALCRICPRPAAHGRGLPAGRLGLPAPARRPGRRSRRRNSPAAPGLARDSPCGAGSTTWPAPRGRVPPAGSARPRLRRRAGRPGLEGRRRAPVVGIQHHGSRRRPSRRSCSRRVRSRSTRARGGRGRLEESDRGKRPHRGQADRRRSVGRRRGRLGDRSRDAAGAARARRRGGSPTAAPGGSTRAAWPVDWSVRVEPGDIIQLQVALARGMPITISRLSS